MNVETKVLDLFDKNGIEHKFRGNDILIKCLNPAHNDNNPSMGVDKITGRFHCFSCGYGGSLNRLLSIFGEKPDINLTFSVKQEELMEKISKVFLDNVRIPETALPYNGPPMNHCSKEELKALEAFTCAEPELADRICFPVINNGKLKFVEARAIDPYTRPRWKRWPIGVDTSFCLNTSVSNCLVLVEGYSDYANLYRLGIKNVSPLFGSQSFNSKKFNYLLDYGIQKLIVFTDNDDAGWTAYSKIAAICKNRIKTKRLVPETDPGDISNYEKLIDLITDQDFKIENGIII